ncbi:MAG TPA: hypothetical protein PLP42_12580 [Acidobacteriota bacterium]|nr:hypothetical protein [Acidobacteriota bacterium]
MSCPRVDEYCNLIDRADIAAPAFGPVDFDQTGAGRTWDDVAFYS